jgi:hypothetical protein
MTTKVLPDRHGGSRLPQASSPPLEPAQMPVGGDGLQHELGESDWGLDTERQGSQPTGKLVAIAVAATLAIGMLAYFLSPSGQEKSTAQSPPRATESHNSAFVTT